MGLTKQYLRFVPGPVFGVIGNSSGNILVWKPHNLNCDFIAVGACENVVVWNCRNGLKEFELLGDKQAVTTIAQNGRMTQLAAGYFDGIIRIFDLSSRECVVKFSGHRTSVSCLAYDADGFRLASGGMDTEIVVWDVTDQAGLYRLKGHNDAVTHVHFLKQQNVLVSSSKDGLLKFWDLDTQHCFKTVVGDNSEIWDLLVVHDSRVFAATGGTSMISVYDLSSSYDDERMTTPSVKRLKTDVENMDPAVDDELMNSVKCVENQQIPIANKGKKGKVAFAVDKNERIFGYHTYRKTLNLFKILNSEEIRKKVQRARKKLKKLHKAEGRDVEESETDVAVTVDYEIDALKPLTFECTIVSFACQMEVGDIAKLVVLLKNNSISICTLNVSDKSAETVPVASICHFGHRTDVKTLSFSSDSFTLLSASKECVKIWNQNSQSCICTLECEAALCSMFTAGNNHCLIGTDSGKIQIFEIGSSELLENIEAHGGRVECICSSPDQRSLVTGGSDKDVKFWDLELVKDEKYSTVKKRLTLSLRRTLKLPDQVLCVKYSPNSKMLAVSLLSNSIKVFFADTLKFAFELYGHSLPVRSMDVSYDSTLIVTGSDDRNVKIWSMEFGSCNKSMFAHADGITCVQFLPKTHMFFTAGKDGKVKQWDADNFQKIITLEGHLDKIDALAISPDGATVVSSSRDKSLRVWEKTDEPLVLSEEQEMEREAMLDKAMPEVGDPAIPGEYNKETSLASKKTVEVTKTVDQLIEAIDVYREETFKWADRESQCGVSKKALPPLPSHPLLVAFSAENPKHYMLIMLRRIKMTDLKEALLLLPFSYVVEFLEILADLAALKWDSELVCNCIVFLLKIHFAQLTSSQKLHPLLDRLRCVMNREVRDIQDIAGFVLVALKSLQMNFDEEEEPLFTDVTKRKMRKKKKVLPVLKSV